MSNPVLRRGVRMKYTFRLQHLIPATFLLLLFAGIVFGVTTRVTDTAVVVDEVNATRLTVTDWINVTAGNVYVQQGYAFCLDGTACTHNVTFNGTHTVIN